MDVKMCTLEDIGLLVETLKSANIHNKKALIGFDGYIDVLYRVVKSRSSDGKLQFYKTITEYANRLATAAGKSADLELIMQNTQFGGNAPIMANCISRHGMEAVCVGALGSPKIEEPFFEIDGNCKIISFASPCRTIALEFEDGKIMMGDLTNGQEITWERLLNSVGEKEFCRLIEESDLIGVLNWSAHCGVEQIFKGIMGMVSQMDFKMLLKKTIFVDLADPSARSAEELQTYLQEIATMGKSTSTILGVNENEVMAVFRCLFPDKARVLALQGEFLQPTALLYELGNDTMNLLNLHALVLHTVSYSIAFNQQSGSISQGFYVNDPLLSTGGGDNFNAGFCTGMIMGLPLTQSLILGDASSSYYVSHGESATLLQLASYIRDRMLTVDPIHWRDDFENLSRNGVMSY